MNKFALIAAPFLLAAALPASALATEILPGNLNGWQPANVNSRGSVAITDTYIPGGAGQTGSLEFNTTAAAGKADFSYNLTNVTLGDIVAGNGISFDFFRDSSSTATAHFAPVIRLAFTYSGLFGLQQTGYLIWEAVYNGVTVTPDNWIHADITDGYFYQRTGSEVPVYNKTLEDYMNGGVFTAGGKSTIDLDANTVIKRIEIGVGSGWNGTFHGAADNLVVNLGSKGVVDANFQPFAAPTAAAVPEPTTWLMFFLGFGLMGGLLRRRKPMLRPNYA